MITSLGAYGQTSTTVTNTFTVNKAIPDGSASGLSDTQHLDLTGQSLFKITDNGAEAVRTQVKLGLSSVKTIEVLDGLKEGDKVIISDMSSVESAERVRLTDEKHLSSH